MSNRLILPDPKAPKTWWNDTLHRLLESSGVFQVEHRSVSKPNQNDGYFPFPVMQGVRNKHWSTFEINGTLVGLDTWDILSPTASFEQAGFFQNQLKDVGLVIKIQHYACEYWDNFQARTGKRASGWTVMPNHLFPVANAPFEWRDGPHKYVASVTGKNHRFGRLPWREWASAQPDFYASDGQDPFDTYCEVLADCRWGLILHGKRGAEKNRREVEYSACGMPLALNYCPQYPFEMKPDVDFVHLKEPSDMEKLRTLDPNGFVESSKRLFRERFSPAGMARTLLQLLEGEL